MPESTAIAIAIISAMALVGIGAPAVTHLFTSRRNAYAAERPGQAVPRAEA
jgi:hypothetical protein